MKKIGQTLSNEDSAITKPTLGLVIISISSPSAVYIKLIIQSFYYAIRYIEFGEFVAMLLFHKHSVIWQTIYVHSYTIQIHVCVSFIILEFKNNNMHCTNTFMFNNNLY